MKKYTNKKLYELANADLIWPKKHSYYLGLLKESLNDKGFNYSKLDDPNGSSDIIHDELWWDVCEIVNNLAQILLEERLKRKKFMDEVKEELQLAIRNLNDKRFNEFY